MVERRWAITIVVRPAINRRSVAWISASTVGSTAEVASSRMRMRGSAGSALAGRDPEREAVEERSGPGVAEAHVGEIDVAGHLTHRFCVGRVGYVGAGVEQGEDAHRPGPGDLPGGHDHGDHAGGGGQLD